MQKKNIFSRSRAYRLLMERLEERSMLAADVEAGFDDSFFDWSQFDDAAWFDDTTWSDPWTVDAFDFGDQPAEADLSWLFGEGATEGPWPAEPETPLPETGGDEPATTEDSWETPAVETADEQTSDTPITDDVPADVGIDEASDVEQPVAEDPVEETVTDCPLPVATEPPQLEFPISSDESNIDAGGQGWEWPVQDDAIDPLLPVDESAEPWPDPSDVSTEGDFWAEPVADAGTDEAELDAGVVDETQPQDGDASLPEEAVSALPDLPVPGGATAAGSAAPPQTGFSARAAAFGAMRMFAGFSFASQPDGGDDGPFFAGGRRRSRR